MIRTTTSNQDKLVLTFRSRNPKWLQSWKSGYVSSLFTKANILHDKGNNRIASNELHPSYQGLATKLFIEACKFASELGFDYVMASCRGNGTENFYKSLGMLECGKIPNGIYEPWGDYKKYDEIILFKELK